jgi:sigma-B regulation protein RsbU (phosphoserine phosphatase)
MLCWILAVTIPIYAGALFMSYQATAERLEADAARDADELAGRMAASLDAVIRPIEGGIRTVAHQLEEIDPPATEYPRRIHGILAAWPEIYGSTIAVEAGGRDAKYGPFAPYFFRRGYGIGFSDLARESYGYRELPWYRRAADARLPIWSAPYFDAGGGETWMVTYSVPFFRKVGAARGRAKADEPRVLAGVVTADLALDWVSSTAAKATLGPIGMGWLASPPNVRPFVAPIGATPERLTRFDPALRPETAVAAGEAMLGRHVTFGLLPSGLAADPAYLAVRHLQTLDWRLMLVIPRAELLANARALLQRQLSLGAFGLALLVAAIWLVAAGVARPIRALARAVGAVSADDATFELPAAPRSDELGVLTDALGRMRDSLHRHIQLRAESLAERARLAHELEIAAGIQQSMLPNGDGADAVPPAVAVAAALRPAKEVGGDLYDYFTRPDGSVLFAVSDVSDKGIPAALFMARLSGLLRVLGAAGEPPDRVLAEMNARLVEGNDACMFATIGCGVLDVATGFLRYASAGHEPPFVRHPDGTVTALPAENGAALGIDAGADYRCTETFVAPGDTLVLFTDGVPEAEAHDGSLFGLERLSAVLGRASDGEPEALIRAVAGTVAAEGSGFHATDDLTVMAIEWRPSEVTVRRAGDGGVEWRIEPETSAGGIRRAQQWLRALLAARAVDRERLDDVELVAEELLTNVVRVAADTADGVRLVVDCALTASEIVLAFRDDGVAFDPTARALPRLDLDVADRDVGGLGILLVRRIADACRYARVDGWNVLEVRLHRQSQLNRGVSCH